MSLFVLALNGRCDHNDLMTEPYVCMGKRGILISTRLSTGSSYCICRVSMVLGQNGVLG
jgi:hypothetical protein